MFMSDSKKKDSPALMIIEKMKKADGSEVEESNPAPSKDGVEQDSSIGLRSAAEEMMSAVESKDITSFMSALDSYLQMKRDEHESVEDQSEGME